MRYVIDIDGTICYPGTGEGRYTDATPIPERIRMINDLYIEGHEIIYHTARGMGTFENDRQKANDMYYKFTADQLVKWGCMFTDLFLGKPAGDFYIDDKGMNLNDFFSKRPY